MDAFQAMQVSGSGMAAERLRLDVIAANIANLQSRNPQGNGPYAQELTLLFQVPGYGSGVTAQVVQDQRPQSFPMVYDPTSPYANAAGYVTLSNVDLATQMTDALEAAQAYQANVNAYATSRQMESYALQKMG